VNVIHGLQASPRVDSTCGASDARAEAGAPSTWDVLPRSMCWVVVAVATVVSSCALDMVATSVGVLLVASYLFDGAPEPAVLGVLAATYVLWIAGLRANLVANRCLLERTGMSTNLPSKLLFELVRHRSKSERAQRTAAAAGYIATEIAKEAPYYAGAFGAAMFSDTVDSTDALVFLAGTNIGAAVYEYGVARLSRTFVRRRARRLV
jgi:hypothetical protein